MANDWDDDDDEFEQDPAANTPLAKKLRKEIKAREKALAEREAELAALRTKDRARTVKDVLGSKGLNPKLSMLIPADVEPTEEAVGAWLDNFADVFGIEPKQQDEPDNNPDAQQAAMIAAAQNRSAPVALSPDISQKLDQVTSKEELDQLIFGQRLGR